MYFNLLSLVLEWNGQCEHALEQNPFSSYSVDWSMHW